MNQTNASMIDRARQQRPFFEPIGQPSRWQVLMDKIRVLAPTRGFAKPLRAVGAIARSIAGMIVGAVTLGSLVACVEAVVFDAVGPGMSVGHEIANLDRDETDRSQVSLRRLDRCGLTERRGKAPPPWPRAGDAQKPKHTTAGPHRLRNKPSRFAALIAASGVRQVTENMEHTL